MLAGARAPEQIEVSLANSPTDDTPLDFTTVTAFTLRVHHPDGTRATWDVEVTSQTTDTAELVHVFDDEGVEVERTGEYHVQVEMTVSAGVRRTNFGILRVTRT